MRFLHLPNARRLPYAGWRARLGARVALYPCLIHRDLHARSTTLSFVGEWVYWTSLSACATDNWTGSMTGRVTTHLPDRSACTLTVLGTMRPVRSASELLEQLRV